MHGLKPMVQVLRRGLRGTGFLLPAALADRRPCLVVIDVGHPEEVVELAKASAQRRMAGAVAAGLVAWRQEAEG